MTSFIVQAVKNGPITIYGASKPVSFFYLEDRIVGLTALIGTDRGLAEPGWPGNQRDFAARELADQAIELTRSHSTLVFRPLAARPMQRQPDISLTQQKAGWEPRNGLNEGLRHTTGYFYKLLSGMQ
jgi:UDP-glucuronate decarboxylase